MHARMEDLLKIRDGEPIDAEVRERIMADPECVRELERLRRTRTALAALPELMPPSGAWERIAAEARQPAAERHPATARKWIAAAAGAAAAGMALWLWAPVNPWPTWTAEPTATVATGLLTEQADSLMVPPGDYGWLIAESVRLERMLAELPRQRQLMSAGIAGTIVALEDHIAWIDEQLTEAAVRDAEPQQREWLWNERVEVMNALLQVRYAQAQHTSF